jgi:hypothetical protein
VSGGAGLCRDGWLLLPSHLPAALTRRLAAQLDAAYGDYRALQLRNGIGEGTDGTLHHLPCAGDVFLELLEADHGQVIVQSFFDGPYILNTYGGVLNLPNDAS